MRIQSYKQLIVWQKSMDLVHRIYLLTKQFPKSEVYALTSQMQRAAVAIPSNIAEGYVRNHRPEYVQFLGVANASAAELETQLLIAEKEYPHAEYKSTLFLVEEIKKMLYTMIINLKRPTS